MIFGALRPLAHTILIINLGKRMARGCPNLVIISVGPCHKQKATVVLLKHDQNHMEPRRNHAGSEGLAEEKQACVLLKHDRNHMEPRRNHAGVEGLAEAKQTFARMLAL